MFRSILALCIAVCAASPSAAKGPSSADSPVTVITPNSAGMPSCGAWTTARANPSNGGAAQYEKWVWGFESGLNFARFDARGDVLRNTDTEALSGWVDEYCRGHPLDTLVEAVIKLDKELARRSTGR